MMLLVGNGSTDHDMFKVNNEETRKLKRRI